MQYHVVPFVANVNTAQGAQAAAAQLHRMVNELAAQGWEFMRLERVETVIAGNNGCFGLGATPPVTTAFSMAVFRR